MPVNFEQLQQISPGAVISNMPIEPSQPSRTGIGDLLGGLSKLVSHLYTNGNVDASQPTLPNQPALNNYINQSLTQPSQTPKSIMQSLPSPESIVKQTKKPYGIKESIKNAIPLPADNSPMGLTLNTIKKFEGYSSKPYWDVNAYRSGYGSDTTTLPNGQVVRIKTGMMVNREDSERDLQRRTLQFQSGIINQIGQDTWNTLHPGAQAALTSIAYNYGSLPKRILPAVKSGNLNMISEAIKGLGRDNKGINKNRRNIEANMVVDPTYFNLGQPGTPLALNDSHPLLQEPIPNTNKGPVYPVPKNLPKNPFQNPGQGMASIGTNPNLAPTGINWQLLLNSLPRQA